MADLLCSFLPLFLPPKRYSSSALHSLNSRRPLHLPLLFKHSPFAASASPSDVVVISTHEHSDGSFLFRFGDPSEVVKNVEMEEAKIVKEEIEGEEESNGSSTVEVLEGQDESEATASGLIEDSDHVDSIVSSSNTLVTVEGESEFSEKYKDEEFKDLSPDLDVERTGIDEEYKDLSPVEASIPDESLVEVFDEESLEETSKVTCTSKETEITSFHGVEECLNQEVVDSLALFRARAVSSSLFRSSLLAPSRFLSTGAGEMAESKEVPSLKSMMNQMLTLDISSQYGSCMPLSNMRIGMQIHNIELRPGQGGKLVRAAGTSAKILTEPNRSVRYCEIKLPSGEKRLIDKRCRATIGAVSNPEHGMKKLRKAGQSRWRGIRPTVRGVAMNPIDHPHGGGEGKSKSSGSHGQCSRTPWGKPTKSGYKTAKIKKRKI